MEGKGGSGLDDADVVIQSLESPAAFEVVFERHATDAFRFLARQTNAQVAEDLLAETFLLAFRSRGHFDTNYRSSKPWILGIAANVARHHFRSEQRRHRLLRRLRSLDPPPANESSEVDDHLLAAGEYLQTAMALKRLSSGRREIVLLSATGLTYPEIASALDLPIGTVRSRLSRARSNLRELLNAEGQSQMEDKDEALVAHEQDGEVEDG
jgi:RNA polymerase sigma factor (sigma-70 family)